MGGARQASKSKWHDTRGWRFVPDTPQINGKHMNKTLSAAAILLSSLSGRAVAETDSARIDMGKALFTQGAEPSCSICHTLADAETMGEIGPNLDTMRPDYDRVMRALVNGVGPMTPYDSLTDEELDALSHYVASATKADNVEP